MFEIVSKVSELPAFDKTLPIFSDIETDGFYTNFRMIQFLQPQTSDTVYIVDIAQTGYDKEDYEHEFRNIKEFVMQHHTVFYNSSYDLGTLDISPSIVNGQYHHMTDDLYYLVKTAYAEFSKDGFGLKKIVKKLRYTQGMYDSTQEDHGAKGFPKGSYISQSAYRYAAIDVIALAKIWDDPKIRNVKENNIAYKVDMMSQAYALIYQQNGLVLNRDMWSDILAKTTKMRNDTADALPATLNVNSPKQVKEYLGTTGSAVDVLVAYALSGKPLAGDANNIIKLRQLRKQVKYLESINFNKMITKFNVAGAGTGRFTSAGGDIPNGFNAQQIPRGFQKLFYAEVGDTEAIGLDYSTLELRLVAEMFADPEMNRQLVTGEDLHTSMALLTNTKKALHKDGVVHIDSVDSGKVGTVENMEGEWITSLDRTLAKGINFGLVFGMKGDTFKSYMFQGFGIKLSDAEAKKFIKIYFDKYPTIGKIHKHIWNNYKKPDFFVYTALGRKIKPRLGTDGINAPIQGTGAEVTKLAVHYLVKDNPDVPMLKYICNVVHDAVYIRVPKGKREYWKNILTIAMLKAWDEIMKTKSFKFKTTPMFVD